MIQYRIEWTFLCVPLQMAITRISKECMTILESNIPRLVSYIRCRLYPEFLAIRYALTSYIPLTTTNCRH
jgi:hypothetical protein